METRMMRRKLGKGSPKGSDAFTMLVNLSPGILLALYCRTRDALTGSGFTFCAKFFFAFGVPGKSACMNDECVMLSSRWALQRRETVKLHCELLHHLFCECDR